jgi:hypothetical protein
MRALSNVYFQEAERLARVSLSSCAGKTNGWQHLHHDEQCVNHRHKTILPQRVWHSAELSFSGVELQHLAAHALYSKHLRGSCGACVSSNSAVAQLPANHRNQGQVAGACRYCSVMLCCVVGL